MLPGDLVLTPNWTWHDHANDSNAPMLWLDGLDSPLIRMLECGFRAEYEAEAQSVGVGADPSFAKYGAGGLRPAWEQAPTAPYSPLWHYAYTQTREALERLAAEGSSSPFDGVIMEYTNPVTGGPAMPTIGCYVQLVRPGEHTQAHRHTSSAAFHVIAGSGYSIVDGQRLDWEDKDVFCVPGWAFPEQAQEEFFAGGPDVLASSALNPTRGTAEPMASGYRVSGHWSFSSGCDAASWVMVAVQRPNRFIWALLPRPDYEILDTWFTSGMRGTGSKDIVIRDVFVPEYRMVDPSRAGDGEWTGWKLHRRLSYRLPLRCMTGWDLVTPLVGIAQGAIDAFTASLRGTSGPGRTADSVLVQVRLAEAAVEVDAARELHRRAIRDMLEKAERGEEFTPLERARYRRDKTFAAKLCVQAVNRLFEASGGRALLESEPIQRFHRDVNAALHHQGISWDAAAEDFGRQALGLSPAPGRFG